MKIKVFKFEVANASSSPFADDRNSSWFSKKQARLSTPSAIEKTINKFTATVKVEDIKVSTVNVHYHNNGRGNTIELWYTILYSELKGANRNEY